MARVLIAEDSPTQAEQLTLILESEGFEVVRAKDGLEALGLLQAGAYDLIVTDIVMPGLTGYELCRKVKGDPARRDTPVILLTTLGDPMNIIQGLESGADNFITKPYDADYLVSRVRTVLENKRIRSQEKVKLGVEFSFLKSRFTITSDKEQILDLLISTFEDVVRANRDLKESQSQLAIAKGRIEEYAQILEGRVRSSEEKYRSLMGQANDAIFILNSAGRILEVNGQAEKMLGRTSAELVGKNYREFLADDQRRDEREGRGPGRDRPSAFRDLHFRRADGKLICVDLSTSAVELDRERFVIAIARDVTERNLLERQFHQSQKMEAIGQLAGGVAHDFNNLLTVITGYSDLMLSKLKEGDPFLEGVQEIRRASERAASLTRQLLAFSRKQIVTPRVIHLNSVVAEMDKLLRRLIGEDVSFSTTLSGDLGPVKVDAGQMEQVLMNLAVNARDAMPKGGKLTIETANAELDETYARDHPGARPGSYVMIAVSDTGSGMDEETQSHIFEPFFTTKEIGKGTGLGLATVYGIVKQSGGYVGVYSELGRGTTFKIYLPRASEEKELKREEAPRGAPARGSETILLVEDEDFVRRLSRHILESRGYEVLEARNGQEARALSEGHRETIHLLVTDVVMPELGGVELAGELARSRPAMKILYLSGYTDHAIVNNGLLLPGLAFLQKPFTPDALSGKVREVLDRP